jgi:hypothetical protein
MIGAKGAVMLAGTVATPSRADQGVKDALPYPGSDMGPDEVLVLAETYRASALRLLTGKDSNKLRSSAPFRLLIIHAIELYLNAYLLASGTPATAIRGMQHDLGKRAVLAQQTGMVLRLKTADHLMTLSQTREYLVSRYGSLDTNSLSQLNRLRATVEEVRERTGQRVNSVKNMRCKQG